MFSCGLILFAIIILINWVLLLRERKRKRLAQLKVLKTAAGKFPNVWKSKVKMNYRYELSYLSVALATWVLPRSTYAVEGNEVT